MKDASTSQLTAIGVVCVGLLLPKGLSASVNDPWLCCFSRYVLIGCRSSIKTVQLRDVDCLPLHVLALLPLLLSLQPCSK